MRRRSFENEFVLLHRLRLLIVDSLELILTLLYHHDMMKMDVEKSSTNVEDDRDEF